MSDNVSGTFLSTHLKTDTTLHFSTATAITSIRNPGDGTSITFTGCSNPTLRDDDGTEASPSTLEIANASGTNANLMLNTNDNGRFTAEFSIISRE